MRLKLFVALMFIILASSSTCKADTLKLDELVARARVSNPDVRAMRSRYEAAAERVPQAGALDDPMLMLGFMGVEVENFAFDRIPMTTKDIGISQKVPFYGKRGLREKAASYEYDAARAEYEETLLSVGAEVKKAYFELWYIARALATVEKNMLLADALAEVAQTRYSVGKGPFGDVLKARLEQTGLVDRKLELKKDERTMRAMLGALTGGAPVEGGVSDYELTTVGLEGEPLVLRAAGARPSVIAAEARMKKGDAMVELANKQFYPDFEASVRYSQTDTLNTGMRQSDRISAQITVNLPVWRHSKLEPGVREAAAERAMAGEQRESELTRIRYRVESLLGELEQADRTMKLYRDVAIPQATESLDALLASYEVGGSDFMAVIDARRMLYEYELGYYRAMASHEKSAVELEAVVGGKL